MAKVVVVYHSGFGHTKVLAEEVAAGAAEVSGTDVELVPVESIEEKWDALDGADALIFGTPTYMGSVSGPFKSFMDSTGRRWLSQQWKGKIAAGFTNSGSPNGDKQNTLTTLWVFSQQHSMYWVPLNLMPTGQGPEDLNRLGVFEGAAALSENAPADVTPPAGDRKTARHLGGEVAKFTAIVLKGRS